MTTASLKEMGIKVGKMDRLKVLAVELGIEPEDGQDEFDLAESMIGVINSKDDNEWEAMTSDLKEWSNSIVAAKKLYKENQAKSEKKAPVKAEKKAPVKAEKKAPVKAEKKAPVKAEKKAPVKAEKKAPVKAEKKEVPTKPTKAQLDEMKAAAKEKAASATKGTSTDMWRSGSPAFQAMMVLKDAGPDGLTIEKALKAFEAKLKKAKLESPNPEARLRIIFKDAVSKRGFAIKNGDTYVATKKLLDFAT